jgi:hypothetical protein
VAVPVSTSAMTRSEELSATIEAAMRAVGNAVDEGELAGVISQSTGIPVSNMLGDTEKVLSTIAQLMLNSNSRTVFVVVSRLSCCKWRRCCRATWWGRTRPSP